MVPLRAHTCLVQVCVAHEVLAVNLLAALLEGAALKSSVILLARPSVRDTCKPCFFEGTRGAERGTKVKQTNISKVP